MQTFLFPSKETRERVLVPLALAVGTLFGALLLIGGELPQLRTSVLGLGSDPYQTLWRFSALAEAVSKLTLTVPEDPIRNFGPLPWLPLHALVGEPLGYNLVWVLQFPLMAVATYGLGRRVGIARGPAAIAGLLTAFAPYRIAQSLGHFGAMQLFWIPFSIAALFWLFERPSLPRMLLSAAALIGTAWTEHVLFLTTLLAAALVFVVSWRQVTTALRTPRDALLAVGLLLLVGAFGIFPFRQEIGGAARSDSRFTLVPGQRLRFAPTLTTLLTPPPFHLLRSASNPYGTPRQAVADHVHTLGLLATVTAAFGSWRLWHEGKRQQLAFLGGLLVVGILLAIAPRTALGAQLIDELPLFSAIRTVNRFLALPVLAVPLLAAIGFSRLPRFLGALVVGALLLEILPGAFPAADARIPPFATTLAQIPKGSLLEIPAATDYLVSSRAQYASTVHRHSILASNAFERVEDRARREAPLRIPLLGALLSVRVEDFERLTTDRSVLTREGVVAVIVHEQVLGLPTLRSSPEGLVAITPAEFSAIHRLLRALGLQGEHVGEGVTLYRVH